MFVSWNNKNEKEVISTSTSVNRDYQIYLITMDKLDQHWYLVNQGAADMARILRVTYQWDAPETKDTARQIEILNNAVENGADAIMLAANDPIAISDALEAA